MLKFTKETCHLGDPFKEEVLFSSESRVSAQWKIVEVKSGMGEVASNYFNLKDTTGKFYIVLFNGSPEVTDFGYCRRFFSWKDAQEFCSCKTQKALEFYIEQQRLDREEWASEMAAEKAWERV